MYMNLTLLFELVYNSYILAIKILLGIIFFQVSFILGHIYSQFFHRKTSIF